MGRGQASNRQFLDIPLANGNFRSASSTTSTRPPLNLTTTREESTRVQLQKQRLREQHHAVVVSQRIPGYKTSAAFFASLRTNLRLNASPPPSPWSTPPSMRASTGSLPPPSPLSSVTDTSSMAENDSAAPEDPLAGVPELNTYLTNKEEDKVDAMKLVADSVAQMRQTTNSILIFHPLNLAILVAVVAAVARYIYQARDGDVGVAGTTCTGLLMIILVGCRFISQGYIVAAEKINWEWLGTSDVIVTKFGEDVMGTVIIDWISEDTGKKRKKILQGEIQAWTVRMKYRRKGVGQSLLEEAVNEAKKKGAETLAFAPDHANAKRILPRIYNGKFDRGDKQARELLQDLLESSPARGKRKRPGST